jgi:hypothetical protein
LTFLPSVLARLFRIIDDDRVDEGLRGNKCETELLQSGKDVRFAAGGVGRPLQIEVVPSEQPGLIDYRPVCDDSLD